MKTYIVTLRYKGRDGFGIYPWAVRANTAREAVRTAIAQEKEHGNEVLEVRGVAAIVRKPKGGWLENKENG